MHETDVSQLSMREILRLEAETQTAVLNAGLLALESSPRATNELDACMRAAHSLKGAARIVNLSAGVALAHAMEDCFAAAQKGQITLDQPQIDLLLGAVDLMVALTATPACGSPDAQEPTRQKVASLITQLTQLSQGTKNEIGSYDTPPLSSPSNNEAASAPTPPASDTIDRVLRITVENVNRLLGLATESLVETRQLAQFGHALNRLKQAQYKTARDITALSQQLSEHSLGERARASLNSSRTHAIESQRILAEHLSELDIFDRRSTKLAHNLYHKVLACRMRPFGDSVQHLPRMVRDLARRLGKRVRLEISGTECLADRDILEQLDAPLGHLLRNALDHGVEAREERMAAGKPADGVVRVAARHSAGMLQIDVSDDGRGIDLARLRTRIVDRKLSDQVLADRLSERELLDYLFLPGFSMRDDVTDVSGRGVGLDAVRTMVKEMRGTIHVTSNPGKGTCFHLQLPLTLSVVRALVTRISGQLYAFPLANIVRAIMLSTEAIETLEGRQHFTLDDQQIGLVATQELFGPGDRQDRNRDCIPVVIVNDHESHFGFIVDRFFDTRELVIQPLDARLGKIRNVSAAALMPDGSPVLIIDVADMIRSTETSLLTTPRAMVDGTTEDAGRRGVKRVLVVDDSLTVRELQRKLLLRHGYLVDVAVDGIDGWNRFRSDRYDLVITDIDMPRMNGFELVMLMKSDPKRKSTPVMIVSYKDRDEERQRGFEIGADYYLTKSTFRGDKLVDAVVDLIGNATS